ncbi:MAG TPA: LysM peptidoglycan-binding domain-containing protein [Candidatus Limnocylindrales bacterium]|nr:LysM peptidoglycan-binding domain-containing protein [Candidatus Limnocylindrales bacterium]
MKKISFWFLILTFAVCAARGQDAAAQQQLDKLSGQIKDLTDTVEVQRRRIDALEREISELRDKVSTPQVNDSASREDLKALATQVQEIDKKRQDDRDLILKEIEKLGKVAAAAPHKPSPNVSTPKPTDDTATAPATPQKGYDYEVKPGDSLGLIAKAYRAQGVKVTTTQIIAANPKMNPNVLIPGKKIFIPDPAAK